MGAYENTLKQLNSAQLDAVTSIDGPLLVIAGPGTGKTQLLSSRVAHILASTDTPAASVLCLTFTNKAALNMRERIIAITGTSGRDVQVKTFHSFAMEVMNWYPDHFWHGARLSAAPDALQREIVQNILGQLPLDNPLAQQFYGTFTALGDVMQGLKLAKEAGLTPDKLAAIIQANIAYIDVIEAPLCQLLETRLHVKKLEELATAFDALPVQHIDELVTPLLSLSTVMRESLHAAIESDIAAGKTSQTSAWKRRWMQTIDGKRSMDTERRRNAWWLALADVYAQYRDGLHERGFYDYADMIVEVLSVIEQHPELRAELQERFLYVMIDEFQDTNAAQLRLAHLVADHFSASNKPNIMVVGDDDQSIFKFNGAELSNMLHFRRAYPACKTVVLRENYRSTQAILDFAERIIEQASDRLVRREPDLSKQLQAVSDQKPGLIQHLHYRTQDEQRYDIATRIAERFSSDRSIAVIARSHSSLITIAQRLLALDIPLHYEQQRNILDHPLVEQTILLAEIAQAISDGDITSINAGLHRSLQHPMWRLDANQLWQLAIINYRSANWLESLHSSKSSLLKQHGAFLTALAPICARENLTVSLEYILGLRELDGMRSPLHDYYVVQKHEGSALYLHGLSAIRSLRSLVYEYSTQPKVTVVDFVRFVDSERRSGAVINDESPFVTGEDAVSLLTVHKAKGLEFDEVFVIDAVEQQWQPRTGGRKPPANLPLQPHGDDMDDYVRLLFVAVTRAKCHLTLASYATDSNNRACLTTPLLSAVIEPREVDIQDQATAVVETSLSWPRLDHDDEKALLRARLTDYSLSVTHLLNFLDVSRGGPQLLLERNILRLPEAKTPSLSFGTAIHAALETAQQLSNSGAFSLEPVIERYIRTLEAEHMPFNDEKRYKKHGADLLTKLFENNLLKLHPGGHAEQTIRDVSVGKARLSGKLDQLIVSDSELLVSDYKTGKPLHSFATRDTNKQIKAWKHRTQLIFYAVLLQHSPRFYKKQRRIIAQMLYLEANSAKEICLQYEPSAEDIEMVARLSEVVWQKIVAMDLPDTSSYAPDMSGIEAFQRDLLA